MSAAVANEAPLLEVRNLSTRFRMGRDEVQAVRSVDLLLKRREVLGIIGESGSGKSVTGLSILRLLPAHASVSAGKLSFNGQELLPLDDEAFRQLRGTHFAMVFQDPTESLNPRFQFKSHRHFFPAGKFRDYEVSNSSGFTFNYRVRRSRDYSGLAAGGTGGSKGKVGRGFRGSGEPSLAGKQAGRYTVCGEVRTASLHLFAAAVVGPLGGLPGCRA